jgi:dTDP-4-dehydrorhamnose reductase
MMKATKVDPVALSAMTNFLARRPVYTVLGTEKFARVAGKPPRDWHDAVEEYVRVHVAQKEIAQSPA